MNRHVRRWSAIPLRLILGYGFMAHGYAKIANGPTHFATSLQALGVPQPTLMAWTTIVCELAGWLARGSHSSACRWRLS